ASDAQSTLIDSQARTHRGRDGDLLQIHTLRRCRLGLFQICHQSFKVFLDVLGREFNVTQRSVDNAVFISAVANLTGFGVLDRSLNVCSYSANLRVRHQATGTKDLAQLTDHTHGIRSGNNHVEVHVAFLHFVSQIIHTHHVCTGSSGFFGIGTLGEHSYTNSLASTVRQNSAATYDLVRFTCINAQVYGYVYRLFELDVLAQLGQQ